MHSSSVRPCPDSWKPSASTVTSNPSATICFAVSHGAWPQLLSPSEMRTTVAVVMPLAFSESTDARRAGPVGVPPSAFRPDTWAISVSVSLRTPPSAPARNDPGSQLLPAVGYVQRPSGVLEEAVSPTILLRLCLAPVSLFLPFASLSFIEPDKSMTISRAAGAADTARVGGVVGVCAADETGSRQADTRITSNAPSLGHQLAISCPR